MPKNLELLSWSDLQAYWDCPRAWAYRRLGYSPPPTRAMRRGTLVHAGIAAARRGLRVSDGIKAAAPSDVEIALLKESQELCERFQAQYGSSLVYTHIESELTALVTSDGIAIGGHPDSTGIIPGAPPKRFVEELKTSAAPDPVFLDHSGQVDWYALLVEMALSTSVERVFIDVISPGYITRMERPVQRAKGERILMALLELAGETTAHALESPHFGYRCANCPFLQACKVREAGGTERSLLEKQFGEGKE